MDIIFSLHSAQLCKTLEFHLEIIPIYTIKIMCVPNSAEAHARHRHSIYCVLSATFFVLLNETLLHRLCSPAVPVVLLSLQSTAWLLVATWVRCGASQRAINIGSSKQENTDWGGSVRQSVIYLEIKVDFICMWWNVIVFVWIFWGFTARTIWHCADTIQKSP